MIDVLSVTLIAIGALFFVVSSIGIIRFPDVYTRLHTVTKGDNLGLGFVVLGLSLQAESWLVVAKMFFIWALVMVASATAGHLIGEAARLSNVLPWRKSS